MRPQLFPATFVQSIKAHWYFQQHIVQEITSSIIKDTSYFLFIINHYQSPRHSYPSPPSTSIYLPLFQQLKPFNQYSLSKYFLWNTHYHPLRSITTSCISTFPNYHPKPHITYALPSPNTHQPIFVYNYPLKLNTLILWMNQYQLLDIAHTTIPTPNFMYRHIFSPYFNSIYHKHLQAH